MDIAAKPYNHRDDERAKKYSNPVNVPKLKRSVKDIAADL